MFVHDNNPTGTKLDLRVLNKNETLPTIGIRSEKPPYPEAYIGM